MIITSSLGALNGASQSIIDLILACNQSKENLSIIYNGYKKIPKTIDGYFFKNLKFYKLPKNEPFPKFTDKKKITKIRRWIDGKLFDFIRSKKLNKIKYDLIMVNSISGHFILRKSIYHEYKNKVLIVRESPRHFEYKLNHPKPLEEAKEIISSYNKIIFVSSNILSEWKTILSLKDEQCAYIPNCVHEDKIKTTLLLNKNNTKKYYNFSKSNFNVVCISSLQYRKGQDIIINLLPKLIEKIPTIKLHLIGPYTQPYTSEILSNKEYLNNKNNIKLWGSRKDVHKMIYAADLFLFPSRAEAFPRAILESMALKTPIVSSDVDGISEMLNNNTSALLFTHPNYDKIINDISLIYKNKNLSISLTEKASKDYWNKFSREQQINRLTIYLKKIEKEILNL